MASKYIVTKAQREAGKKEGKSVRDIVRARETAERIKKASKSKKKSSSKTVKATPRAAAVIKALADAGDTKAQKIQRQGVSTPQQVTESIKVVKPKKIVTPTPVAVLSPRVAQAIAEAPKAEQERLLKEKGIVQVKAAGSRISRDVTLKETAPTKTRFIPEQLAPAPIVKAKVKRELKSQGIPSDISKEFVKGKETKELTKIVGVAQAETRGIVRQRQSGKLTASEFQKEIKGIQSSVDAKVAGINLKLKAEAGQPTEVIDSRPTQQGFSQKEIKQIGREQKVLQETESAFKRQEKFQKDVAFVSKKTSPFIPKIPDVLKLPALAFFAPIAAPIIGAEKAAEIVGGTVALGGLTAGAAEKSAIITKAQFTGTLGTDPKASLPSRIVSGIGQVQAKTFSKTPGAGLAQPAIQSVYQDPQTYISAAEGAALIAVPKLVPKGTFGGSFKPSKAAKLSKTTKTAKLKAPKGQKTLAQTFKAIEKTSLKPKSNIFQTKGTRSVQPKITFLQKGKTGLKQAQFKKSGSFTDPGTKELIPRISPQTKTAPQTRLSALPGRTVKFKKLTGKEAFTVETEFGVLQGRPINIQKTPIGTRITVAGERTPISKQIAYTKPTTLIPKKGVGLLKSKTASSQLTVFKPTTRVSAPTISISRAATAVGVSPVVGASSLIRGATPTTSFGFGASTLGAIALGGSIGSRQFQSQSSALDSAISARQAQSLIQLPSIKIATQQKGLTASEQFSDIITQQKSDVESKSGLASASTSIQRGGLRVEQRTIFQQIAPISPVIPVIATGIVASQLFRPRTPKKKTTRKKKGGNEGGGLIGSSKYVGLTKGITKYTPSLIAVALDIRGEKLKGPKFGLRIRPVLK